MSEVGEFIGNYQVSSLLASSHACELYEVRPKDSQSTLPVVLAFWPELEVNGSEEANVFQQKVRQGSIHSGVDTIPILDADLDKGHPYIVSPYSTNTLDIWRKHVSFIDQALQDVQLLHPDDAHALINAFLSVFMGNATEEEPTISAASYGQNYGAPASFDDQAYATAIDSNLPSPGSALPIEGDLPPVPPPSDKKKVKWYHVALLVLLLILLIWGGGALYAIIPASAATITITPMKKQFSQSYNFGVVTGKPADLEIQGRQITVTSQRIVKTVPVTGKGHHNATQARGIEVLSQVQLNDPSKPIDLVISGLTDANGLQITTDEVVSISNGATVKIPAHIAQAGSAGNIPADDFDGQIEIVDTITNVRTGTAYASNPAPFTGGTDARDFTFVQQADLDKVTKPFLAQVTTTTQQRVMQQIHTGEYLAKDMQCNPKISSNHRVKDEASDVTVQVSLTCQALVYSEQTVHTAAASVYQHDGVAKFGDGYSVVGDMVMGTITTLNSPTNNAAQLSLNVAGIWSFQYTDARKQDIERIVAGKPQDAARLLLSTRKDIQSVAISTSGIPGSALPSSSENIKIVATKVDGLHASS